MMLTCMTWQFLENVLPNLFRSKFELFFMYGVLLLSLISFHFNCEQVNQFISNYNFIYWTQNDRVTKIVWIMIDYLQCSLRNLISVLTTPFFWAWGTVDSQCWFCEAVLLVYSVESFSLSQTNQTEKKRKKSESSGAVRNTPNLSLTESFPLL